MKLQNQKNIDKLINKVLNETLESKAETLENKLKYVDEDMGGMEDAHPTFGEMTPKDLKKYAEKYFGPQDDEWINLTADPKDENEYPDFVETFESDESEGEMCSECNGSGMMNEIECSECGGTGKKYSMEEGLYDVSDDFLEEQSFDYVEEETDIDDVDDLDDSNSNEESCRYHMEKFGPDNVRTKKFCIGFDIPELGLDKHLFSMNENLKGKQKKIDKNRNNKIDAEDFKLLRKKKKTQTHEGNAFTGKLAKTKKGKEFELDGKKYKDTSNLDEKECMECGGSKYPVIEKWEGDVEVEKTGEHSNKSIDQINSEIKKLKQQSETYKEKGKKVPSGIKEKMSELYFAKRAKQGWKGKGKAKVKESISLTESELIELIENIVMEEKNKKVEKNIKTPNASVPGLKKYKQAFDASGKENEDYLKSVTKKMKDYLKDGSKGEYSMEPKTFPMGNGQIEKMNKKAYVPSDAVQDYTDNLTAAGLENLDYDEIHPNEDWVSKNIEGSSQTGNNPEWANAVETGVNKKRNKIRKDNMLAKIKRKAYNKAPQPIVSDKAGEDSGSKLMMKLESKKQQQLMEEIQKINNLTSYNKKTQ